MLIELLSHQNFADMRHGLDPSFRFTVSRSIYKGILKYLSNRFGCGYVVQPLPVTSVAAEFSKEGKAVISWKPVYDHLEPTATPEGYIVYRRVGNGCFDSGTAAMDGSCRFESELIPGQVISFKVAAYNDGGISFPSEVVSIGIPESESKEKKVLIVNNFDRISGPAWFEDMSRAGFDNRLDSGVPDMRDITFVGQMHNFIRSEEWSTNECPGFGASYNDMAGEVVAGNTFDYASVHGRAMLEAGYPFYSCSNERFIEDSLTCNDAWAVDLICGKQITTPVGDNKRYTIFPDDMQKAINTFVSTGGNILVSGAYIGTDVWNSIYPVHTDSTARSRTIAFASDVLGYRSVTGKATRRGRKNPVTGGSEILQLVMEMNQGIYCVESPDGIAPASKAGKTIYRYADSGISAGVAYQGNGYRCVSFGFPIEVLTETKMINSLIKNSLDYFTK
jgi:hypothetical protein